MTHLRAIGAATSALLLVLAIYITRCRPCLEQHEASTTFLRNDEEASLRTGEFESPHDTNALKSVLSSAQSALRWTSLSVVLQGDTGHDYFTMKPYDWSNNMPSPCGAPHCDGEYNPKADRRDYEAAIQFGAAVRSLGLAYALTDDHRMRAS